MVLEILGNWLENQQKGSPDSGTYFDMAGKIGIVQKECTPEGTVIVGQELWGAISKSHEPLRPGQKIVVKGRQGMQLYVEKAS